MMQTAMSRNHQHDISAMGAPPGDSQVPAQVVSSGCTDGSWLCKFRAWLPGYLESKYQGLKEGEMYAYPLSSLKSDFQAIHNLKMDHVSLGYVKLSHFISIPELCRMRSVPVSSSNAVLFPLPKKKRTLTISSSTRKFLPSAVASNSDCHSGQNVMANPAIRVHRSQSPGSCSSSTRSPARRVFSPVNLYPKSVGGSPEGIAPMVGLVEGSHHPNRASVGAPNQSTREATFSCSCDVVKIGIPVHEVYAVPSVAGPGILKVPLCPVERPASASKDAGSAFSDQFHFEYKALIIRFCVICGDSYEEVQWLGSSSHMGFCLDCRHNCHVIWSLSTFL